MSFLAPLFLLGGLAVGLPIVFHLIRRTTREQKVFSSLMFLSPSPPRLTRRNRIEHLLLLLLRCVVIGLLAFGFARPFLKQTMTAPVDSARRRILLLIDTSASMRRANLWPDARSKAESILRNTSPGDQVALFTFDRQLKALFTFDQWNAAPLSERAARLSQRLVEVSPGWAGTQLGSALIQAAETLADAGGKKSAERGRIELITDLQEGSHFEQLQGYEWPKGIEVSINLLKPREVSNASLQLVSDSEESDLKSSANVRVRVANSAGAKREQFKVGWALPNQAAFATKPLEVYVPAGQSRVLTLPTATKSALDSVLLQGDDEPFDNVVFASPPEAVKLNVIYLGNDTEGDSKQALYFLRRSFQETRHETVRVTAHRPGELLPAGEVQSSSLFVIAAPLSNDSIAALREEATGGKTLLVMLGAPAIQPTLGRILEVDGLRLEEVRPPTYAMLGEIDFRHSIFAPFSDPRFSDFTKIHFWRYCRLDSTGVPRARVLARFDSGDPALIEVPLGAGRVLILTSGWQPDSSQLALSSKFVPLMYSILENSGASAPLPAQYHIGDVISLGALAGTASPRTVRLPGGAPLALAHTETNFSRTDVPGVYTLATDTSEQKFVVNLDPAESRITPVALDELDRLGVPAVRTIDTRDTQDQRRIRLQNRELENRQKLWRWFIAGTLAVLLIECWLAGRTARRVWTPAKALPT